ncbi:MBL fold metallo-hydrolase [Pararhizobium sp.]|uniref:MBL fold metallo-hydrolase n=1 Tax=Pararhizobium sp. TaxID=1977563 RepID=UPI0027228671|nr:MBL fold metallo-hydrolase [Pararhizobium sp.]MDO9416755.1 MBL fold metallo-hydrolase [Pararhizobium sp.]
MAVFDEAVVADRFEETLAERLAGPRQPGVTLYWLGQAGFVIDTPGLRIVIDPYLSDSLAEKYAGKAFPHGRMAPAPVSPEALGAVDLVLCTHHHTDHMDGQTLSALARRLPDLLFVVPAASLQLAADRIGVSPDRLVPVDAGDEIEPLPGVSLQVLRAAHETLEQDAAGHHTFLGYGVAIEGIRLFHSGDTIPFEGQVDDISALAPDIALLPVNGRSARLAAAGFAGNLTLAEASDLCIACNIPAMIAHHYGLFSFNTADPREIDRLSERAPFQLVRADFQVAFRVPLD